MKIDKHIETVFIWSSSTNCITVSYGDSIKEIEIDESSSCGFTRIIYKDGSTEFYTNCSIKVVCKPDNEQ